MWMVHGCGTNLNDIYLVSNVNHFDVRSSATFASPTGSSRTGDAPIAGNDSHPTAAWRRTLTSFIGRESPVPLSARSTARSGWILRFARVPKDFLVNTAVNFFADRETEDYTWTFTRKNIRIRADTAAKASLDATVKNDTNGCISGKSQNLQRMRKSERRSKLAPEKKHVNAIVATPNSIMLEILIVTSVRVAKNSFTTRIRNKKAAFRAVMTTTTCRAFTWRPRNLSSVLNVTPVSKVILNWRGIWESIREISFSNVKSVTTVPVLSQIWHGTKELTRKIIKTQSSARVWLSGRTGFYRI